MHIDVRHGEDHDRCPSGQSFYDCGSTDFSGCCEVDPCHFDGCPKLTFLDISSLLGDEHVRRQDISASVSIISDSESTTMSEAEESTSVGVVRGSKPSHTNSIFMTIIETRESTIMLGTMTDSGTTRTIPNNSKVTVTKKTTIVTDKSPIRTPTPSTPSSGESIPSTFLTTTLSSTPTETSSTDAGSGNGSSLPTGAIVGMAIGGIAALGILMILIVVVVRRRKALQRSHSNATSNIGTELNDHEEKLPQSMSAHTTGTQGSGDPFAPFGGRVDRADDPHAPPSNTYEMDATSVAPVELPAISVGSQPRPRTESRPVPDAGPSDPLANLNASLTDRRQHMYVNHWDQYRNLGHESMGSRTGE